jgi:hypothetical protein
MERDVVPVALVTSSGHGPFVVESQALAATNATFDAHLRQRDARWGLRVLNHVQAAALEHGLLLAQRDDMPATNLMLRFVTPAVNLDR